VPTPGGKITSAKLVMTVATMTTTNKTMSPKPKNLTEEHRAAVDRAMFKWLDMLKELGLRPEFADGIYQDPEDLDGPLRPS
jgi:hypothetical protein